MNAQFKICSLLAGMFAAMLGYIRPSSAANDPDFTLVFPAGIACEDFDLQVEGWGGNRHFKEFKDEEGNIVRTLDAGTGGALLFTNLDSGSQYSTKSNGAVAHTTYNTDGSYTGKLTGHTVLILFPTDNPPGPSTTLIAGRLIYTVDTNGIWTLEEMSGKTIDICAALP